MMDKEIREMIASIIPLIDRRIIAINTEIGSLVASQETSPEVIERLLDELLGYIPHGYGRDEFETLNQYYSSFNQEYAQVYQRFLNEVIE